MNDLLQEAFDLYLANGDAEALYDAVQRHGGRAPDRSLDCPISHRIGDIELHGRAFRVVRLADPDDRTTRLFIYPTENPSDSHPGVPIALRGEALWRWIRDEMECPTEGETDWSRYVPSQSGDA